MAELEIPFPDPVRVQLGPWRERLVRTVPQAAQLLLNEWPAQGEEFATYAHGYAKWACCNALKGHCTASFARTIFVFAAKQAGIHVARDEATLSSRLGLRADQRPPAPPAYPHNSLGSPLPIATAMALN